MIAAALVREAVIFRPARLAACTSNLFMVWIEARTRSRVFFVPLIRYQRGFGIEAAHAPVFLLGRQGMLQIGRQDI